MLRARERQSSTDKRRLIEQVERICREEFPPTKTSTGAEVTGFFVLLTNLIDSLLSDQWLAFGVASASIGLMMFVAMVLSDVALPVAMKQMNVIVFALVFVRSVVVAVIMLVPNAMPIVMVLGMMGWLSEVAMMTTAKAVGALTSFVLVKL